MLGCHGPSSISKAGSLHETQGASTSPLGKVWSFAYDPAGNLTTKTLPSGSISYAYDQINRLSGITYSNAPTTPNVTFAYDPNSNRTSMTEGQGTVSYTYDALNRLTNLTRGTNTFTYAYDPASNLTSRTYPGNTTVTYGYDSANRMTSVTANAATTTYGYDEASNLTTETLPAANGYVVTMTYDRAGRLTEVKNAKGGVNLSKFTYTLDPVGNPTQVVTATETITHAYDALDRLTQVCYSPTCTGAGLAGIDYTYDAVGNRLSQVRRSTTNTTRVYTYNADDQLTQVTNPNTTYTYDQNGNQASAGTRTFTYDLENRLRTTAQGTTTHTYSYDGDGNRAKDSWGATAATNVNYLWDLNAALPLLALERNGNNALLRRYTYGTSLLAMSTTATNAFYYHPDALGSTANLTNSTGITQWTYTYEPYGTVRSATNAQGAPTNLMRFTGQLIDTVDNLYDLRARMYDPGTGRFLQLDPYPSSGTDPYVSGYAYAWSRPTVATDPWGLNPCFFFGLHYSDDGCVGGGVVHIGGSIIRWVGDQRYNIGVGIAVGCAIASAGACAAAAGIVTFGLKVYDEIRACGPGIQAFVSSFLDAVNTLSTNVGGPLARWVEKGLATSGIERRLVRLAGQTPNIGSIAVGFNGPVGCSNIADTSRSVK